MLTCNKCTHILSKCLTILSSWNMCVCVCNTIYGHLHMANMQGLCPWMPNSSTYAVCMGIHFLRTCNCNYSCYLSACVILAACSRAGGPRCCVVLHLLSSVFTLPEPCRMPPQLPHRHIMSSTPPWLILHTSLHLTSLYGSWKWLLGSLVRFTQGFSWHDIW